MKQVSKKIVFSIVFLLLIMTSCYKSEDVPETVLVEQSEFTQKLLIEDYTGTWCVYCTGAGAAIHTVVHGSSSTNGNDRFVPIALHYRSLANPEEMQNEYSEALVAEFNPGLGFPRVALNRNEKIWSNDYKISDLELLLNKYAPVGLAINSTLTGNALDLTVKVGFVQELTTVNNYKLIVYLVEDGLIYAQHNASLSDQPAIIDDYEHNDVLRFSFTNVFGETIPNQIADDHRYSKIFTAIELPNTIQNISNTRIIAFVVDANNKCLNVQMAAIEVNQDFD